MGGGKVVKKLDFSSMLTTDSKNLEKDDTGIRIESAADLCYRCLDDVATDVLYMTGNDHALEAADPLELAEIKRRWEPYINQLPEYAYICDDLLSGRQ